MAALAITPELAADLKRRYGSLEEAADAAEASREWGDSIYALPREATYWERVAWVHRAIEAGVGTEAKGGNKSKALPRAVVVKIESLLDREESERVIQEETGISRRQIEKIKSERFGVLGPDGLYYEREPGPIPNTWVFAPRTTSQRASRPAGRCVAQAQPVVDDIQIF